MAQGPAYPIESVDRALSVILAFEDHDTLTITEIGRRLGVSRSTAYRLLSVLEHRGFCRQDPRTKAFHGGPALLRVGLAAAQRLDIRVRYRPLLEAIVAEVGETAHLVTLDGGEALFVDCVESARMIRATSRTGTSMPAAVTAGGKVLLANLPEAQLDQVLAGELPRVGGRRLSAAKVRRDLAQARTLGWAFNDGESEVGLRAVSTLIGGAAATSGLDAAVTVAGPAERLDDARVAEVRDVLLARVAAFVAAGQ